MSKNKAIVASFVFFVLFIMMDSLQTSMGFEEEQADQFHIQNNTITEGENASSIDNISEKTNVIHGIIKNGTFYSLELQTPLILTSVLMQEARNPESGAVDLSQYGEGQVIDVSYQYSDGKIVWGARIVD